MSEIINFYVGGYRFGSQQDAEQAQMEQKKADYFDMKLEGRNAANILVVYDKIIDEKVFTTPIGWEYLKTLQMRLKVLGVEEEQIRPIPMYINFSHREEDLATRVRQRIQPSTKRDKSKDQLRISVIINIMLVILVITMFSIALNSKNPNVLNYRKAIVDEYASWEQQLTEREKVVREKEAQLEIENQ